MTKEELVMSVLKPKVASFGFSKDEIKSAAAAIASNLEIGDDALETEEATSKVEAAVGAIIPILKLGQSQANRAIENFKKNNPEPKPEPKPDPEPKPEGEGKKGEGDTPPAWANKMFDTMLALQHEIGQMKAGKTTETRKSRLETLLKDSGSFGKTLIKNFERMTFADEEAFEAYLTEVESDLKDYNQERGNAALGTMGNKPNPAGGNEGKLTETDIKAIVDAM